MVGSGVIDLSYNKTYGHPGDRLHKFYTFLCEVYSEYPLEYIVYEAIKMGFHKSQKANELYFELQGILKLFARTSRIIPIARHAMTIKKGFTGSGKATKEQVADEATARGWEGAQKTKDGTLLNHDEADAIALLCVFMAESGKPFSVAPRIAPVESTEECVF